MLKDKHFWFGFMVGYWLIVLVPAANIMAHLGKGKGQGQGM